MSSNALSLSNEYIIEEDIAKRKREEAKAYLNKVGQSIEKIDTKKSYSNDNSFTNNNDCSFRRYCGPTAYFCVDV